MAALEPAPVDQLRGACGNMRQVLSRCRARGWVAVRREAGPASEVVTLTDAGRSVLAGEAARAAAAAARTAAAAHTVAPSA